ncbi:unnamed protein product, partial [Effrenium voratum]
MRASDWAHRPLLHWQKVYAALDAWILLELLGRRDLEVPWQAKAAVTRVARRERGEAVPFDRRSCRHPWGR